MSEPSLDLAGRRRAVRGGASITEFLEKQIDDRVFLAR